MTIIRVPKSWEIPEQEATPESVYFNRRRFLKTLLGAGVGATIMPIVGCKQGEQVNSKLADSLDTASLAAEPNSTFSAVDRPTPMRFWQDNITITTNLAVASRSGKRLKRYPLKTGKLR
jgi:sulfoxide reductase catalytic subunit YedY